MPNTSVSVLSRSSFSRLSIVGAAVIRSFFALISFLPEGVLTMSLTPESARSVALMVLPSSSSAANYCSTAAYNWLLLCELGTKKPPGCCIALSSIALKFWIAKSVGTESTSPRAEINDHRMGRAAWRLYLAKNCPNGRARSSGTCSGKSKYPGKV